jgi:hypothetical protein
MENVLLHDVQPCPLPSLWRMRTKRAAETITTITNKMWPFADIEAGVLVLNEKYQGNLSFTIKFRTPEGGKIMMRLVELFFFRSDNNNDNEIF